MQILIPMQSFKITANHLLPHEAKQYFVINKIDSSNMTEFRGYLFHFRLT